MKLNMQNGTVMVDYDSPFLLPVDEGVTVSLTRSVLLLVSADSLTEASTTS